MPGRTLATLALIGAIVPSLPAQVQMGSVRLGAIYDNAGKSLRSLIGVPGAAYVGAPLRNGVDQLLSSPDGQWHLLRSGETMEVVPDADPGAAGLQLPIPAQAFWGSDSKTFVMLTVATEQTPAHFLRYKFSPDGGWRDLPALEAHLGSPRILAFDATRDAIWYTTTETMEGAEFSSKTTLWRLDISSASTDRVLELPRIDAFSLPAAGGEVHVLAGDAGRVLLLERAESGWLSRDLEQTPPPGMRISALRSLEGDTLLAVWNPESSSAPESSRPPKLLRYSLSGGVSGEILLEAPADRIVQLRDKTFFLLQDALRPETPLLIYDAANASIFFVPDLRDTAVAGGNR